MGVYAWIRKMFSWLFDQALKSLNLAKLSPEKLRRSMGKTEFEARTIVGSLNDTRRSIDESLRSLPLKDFSSEQRMLRYLFQLEAKYIELYSKLQSLCKDYENMHKKLSKIEVYEPRGRQLEWFARIGNRAESALALHKGRLKILRNLVALDASLADLQRFVVPGVENTMDSARVAQNRQLFFSRNAERARLLSELKGVEVSLGAAKSAVRQSAEQAGKKAEEGKPVTERIPEVPSPGLVEVRRLWVQARDVYERLKQVERGVSSAVASLPADLMAEKRIVQSLRSLEDNAVALHLELEAVGSRALKKLKVLDSASAEVVKIDEVLRRIKRVSSEGLRLHEGRISMLNQLLSLDVELFGLKPFTRPGIEGKLDEDLVREKRQRYDELEAARRALIAQIKGAQKDIKALAA